MRQNLELGCQKWVRLPLLGTLPSGFNAAFLSNSWACAASPWPISEPLPTMNRLPQPPSPLPTPFQTLGSGGYSCGRVLALWQVLSQIRKNPAMLSGWGMGARPFPRDHVYTEEWDQVSLSH